MTQGEINDMIRQADKNGDGVIDFKGFFNLTALDITVGKQSSCLLTFVYASYSREHFRTASIFGNHALLMSCCRKRFKSSV